MSFPLRLEKHYFSRVSISALDAKNAESATMGTTQVSLSVGKDKKNNRHYKIILKVRIISEQNKPLFYQGEVICIGLFWVDEKYPEAQIEKLVAVNGSGILYGAIREMIANITARGPWGSLSIATANFNQ